MESQYEERNCLSGALLRSDKATSITLSSIATYHVMALDLVWVCIVGTCRAYTINMTLTIKRQGVTSRQSWVVIKGASYGIWQDLDELRWHVQQKSEALWHPQ